MSSKSRFEALAESKNASMGSLSGARGRSPGASDGEEPNMASLGSSTAVSRAARASLASQGAGLLGTHRPKPHKIWRKKYVKVLVVGDSGLGKTTLIRALMSTPGERLQVHDGTFTPTGQFIRDPDSLCSTISWRDEDDRIIWVYKMQDTPGYGDTLDLSRAIGVVTSHIEQQNEKWLQLEQSRERKEDLADVEDPRIDLCLFCVGPHRLRASDLKFMYDVGLHVPVVPVVTKADTMTIREAATYRHDVANRIANPMLPGIRDKIDIFHFERDTLARAGIMDTGNPTPPFLVVASNEVNEELNTADPPLFWPERRYPWGVAEAFNKDHSDLLGLRALLLKEALEEINKIKRSRYEAWRRKTLSRGNSIGRKLRRMFMWTIIPAIITLNVGRSGLKVDDIKRHASRVAGGMRCCVKAVTPNKKPEPLPEPEPAPPPPPPPPPPKKFGWF